MDLKLEWTLVYGPFELSNMDGKLISAQEKPGRKLMFHYIRETKSLLS